MWPDDYIEWARAVKPSVGQFVSSFLQRLAKESLVREAVPDMVEEAVRRAFAIVDRWRRYKELLMDAAQFRRLIFATGITEALGLFLDHEYVAARVQKLAPNQRLAVLLRYVGHLSFGDAAPVLGVSSEETKRAVSDGLKALCDLL